MTAASHLQIILTLSGLATSHRWRDDGLCAFGPYESQSLATIYFDTVRPHKTPIACHTTENFWAEVFQPTTIERQVLLAPHAFFLLEGYPDGTLAGQWLASHELAALRSKWART